MIFTHFKPEGIRAPWWKLVLARALGESVYCKDEFESGHAVTYRLIKWRGKTYLDSWDPKK